jgi:hypothetical protein
MKIIEDITTNYLARYYVYIHKADNNDYNKLIKWEKLKYEEKNKLSKRIIVIPSDLAGLISAYESINIKLNIKELLKYKPQLTNNLNFLTMIKKLKKMYDNNVEECYNYDDYIIMTDTLKREYEKQDPEFPDLAFNIDLSNWDYKLSKEKKFKIMTNIIINPNALLKHLINEKILEKDTEKIENTILYHIRFKPNYHVYENVLTKIQKLKNKELIYKPKPSYIKTVIQKTYQPSSFSHSSFPQSENYEEKFPFPAVSWAKTPHHTHTIKVGEKEERGEAPSPAPKTWVRVEGHENSHKNIPSQ